MRAEILKRKTLSWIGIILITITFLLFKEEWGWLTKYPDELIIPFSEWINFSMEKFIQKFGLKIIKMLSLDLFLVLIQVVKL